MKFHIQRQACEVQLAVGRQAAEVPTEGWEQLQLQASCSRNGEPTLL